MGRHSIQRVPQTFHKTHNEQTEGLASGWSSIDNFQCGPLIFANLWILGFGYKMPTISPMNTNKGCIQNTPEQDQEYDGYL